MTLGPPVGPQAPAFTARDPATVPPLLEAWLAGELPDGADPKVTMHSGIDSNGHELGDARLRRRPGPRTASSTKGEYVARVAPARRGHPGLHGLRAPGPVRRHADRRGADRRAGAATSACSSRPARSWARRSSSWTGSTASCRPTCRRTTGAQLARTTRITDGPEAAPGLRPSGRSPTCTRSRTPTDVFGFLDRDKYAGRDRRSRATSPGRAPGTSGRSPTSAGRRWSSARWPGSRPTSPTAPTDTVLCWGDAGSAT